jgi:hypothetical protein
MQHVRMLENRAALWAVSELLPNDVLPALTAEGSGSWLASQITKASIEFAILEDLFNGRCSTFHSTWFARVALA